MTQILLCVFICSCCILVQSREVSFNVILHGIGNLALIHLGVCLVGIIADDFLVIFIGSRSGLGILRFVLLGFSAFNLLSLKRGICASATFIEP